MPNYARSHIRNTIASATASALAAGISAANALRCFGTSGYPTTIAANESSYLRRASVDLTSIWVPQTNGDSSCNLITLDAIFGRAHYSPQPGRTLKGLGSDGVVYTRKVGLTASNGDDLWVARLIDAATSSDYEAAPALALPSAYFKPVQWMPDNHALYLGGGVSLPFILVNGRHWDAGQGDYAASQLQFKDATIGKVTGFAGTASVPSWTLTFPHPDTYAAWAATNYPLSATMAFFVVNGRLACSLHPFTSKTAFNTLLNTIGCAFDVEEADLSGFTVMPTGALLTTSEEANTGNEWNGSVGDTFTAIRTSGRRVDVTTLSTESVLDLGLDSIAGVDEVTSVAVTITVDVAVVDGTGQNSTFYVDLLVGGVSVGAQVVTEKEEGQTGEVTATKTFVGAWSQAQLDGMKVRCRIVQALGDPAGSVSEWKDMSIVATYQAAGSPQRVALGLRLGL